MAKKTYGQVVLDQLIANQTMDDDVIEYRRQMEKEVAANINNIATTAPKHPLYAGRDFYIVLLFKVERIGQAPRTQVFARRSCPTPTYKQSVWKYNSNLERLEFLWSIPDALLYYHILRNKDKYILDKECADLAKFVILMESGQLTQWVIQENGEKVDAVIKLNNPEENEWLMN
jgi:hypothetical protein